MRKRPPPPRRRVSTRNPKKLIVVVCEGSRTEPGYLKSLEKISDKAVVSLRLEDTPHTAPKRLVEVAVDALRESRKLSRKSGDPNAKIDEAWVVCDVDQHPRMPEALTQAKATGVRMAISNPSFELWLLLHFQDQTAHIDRVDALRVLKRHVPTYTKGGEWFDHLVGRFSEASRRADGLDKKHHGDGTLFPHDNPSSGVRHLVDSLYVEY